MFDANENYCRLIENFLLLTPFKSQTIEAMQARRKTGFGLDAELLPDNSGTTTPSGSERDRGRETDSGTPYSESGSDGGGNEGGGLRKFEGVVLECSRPHETPV